MNFGIGYIVAILLIIGVFVRKDIGSSLFGLKESNESIELKCEKEAPLHEVDLNNDYFINDSIYTWSDTIFDWVATWNKQERTDQNRINTTDSLSLSEPIKIDWEILTDINYRLRYFSEMDMEIYAPVFSKTVKSLHKKNVIVEGFVIPFDEEEDLLSLSLNPFASCFFCGNASPASVISLYMKKKRKHYKIDDFKKFKGTLYLNHDDPNDFYYILRDAEEVRW